MGWEGWEPRKSLVLSRVPDLGFPCAHDQGTPKSVGWSVTRPICTLERFPLGTVEMTG